MVFSVNACWVSRASVKEISVSLGTILVGAEVAVELLAMGMALAGLELVRDGVGEADSFDAAVELGAPDASAAAWAVPQPDRSIAVKDASTIRQMMILT